MSDLAEAAVAYAESGWPVLPLEVRGKRPDGRLAPHGLHDASSDPAVVAAWWRRQPEANVGLRTGVAFDVLDVDGADGQAALIAAMPEAEMPLGYGPWSATPGKLDAEGEHLGAGDHVFYLPTGIGNRCGFLPGLDWRGDGGYVVAPPSVHPDGTGTYEWVYGPDGAIEEAPAWLLALVEPPRRPTPGVGAGRPSTPRSSVGAWGMRALNDEVAAVALAPEGNRNHALNRSAFNLGQLVGGGVLDATAVAGDLLTVAVRIGLTETEAIATIRSGLTGGMASPRKQPA